MTNIEFDRVLVKGANTIGTVKIVMVKGDKGDVGNPTDAQVETAVNEWLNDHPEATTTVQDGSITEAKLANDVKHMFGTKADAIVKTASGEIASFTDGGDDLPLKSLKVNIVPKQSGSGDPSPSNVRPISGVDTVGVTRAGKNVGRISQELIDNDRYIDGITFHALSSTSVKITGTSTRAVYMTSGYAIGSPYLRLLKKGTYTFSNGVKASGINGAYITGFPMSGGAYQTLCNSIHEGQTATFTIAEDFYINIQMVIASGYTANDEVWFQLEEGTSATPYEPYEGESKSIPLGQTVYGGTLEAIEGNGTKTYWYKEFDGGESSTGELGDYWGWVGDSVLTPWGVGYDSKDGVCSHFKYGIDTITGADASSGWYFLIKKSALPNITSVAEFKSWVSSQKANGTPLTVCYKLKTPTETFSTTPTQVKTLLGANNIWSDSGTVEVEYRADTTLAYNELLSLIASLS